MTELESSSSASNVGAAAIADGDSSDANVQAKLEKIYEDLQDVALGDIPDGTITKAKMDATYAGTLAEKDGTLQTGLSAEMLNGKTEAQLMSAFLDTVNPETLSFTAGTAPGSTGTNTETEAKTMTTRGGRYYFMVFSYQNCKIALYDAQANKFVFGTYLGTNLSGVSDSTNTFSFNTTSLRLHKGYYNDEVSIVASLSDTTLTVTATKKSVKTSGSTTRSAPSGTITVFELGGKIS